MSEPSEQSMMPGLEGGEDEVVAMDQDDNVHSTKSNAPISTSHASPSSSRRTTRTSAAGGSRRGPGGGGSRGMSNFERERNEIERQSGRGSRNDDSSRQGTEQNIWDKVLDKNGGYAGMLTFDPFQEMINAHGTNGGAQGSTAEPETSLASPSA
ncbi:uncharacterized protein JCM6883_005159 [Sporobolomyces salmoneus]|uniref:uncharacterized protein n=1 Tax=Sporobolomyces salmoneus TaxID=183962 RepID=UPI00317B0F29